MRSLVSQLSIHKLEVFCVVADLQSVSRAADRLGLTQPVVSAHLSALSEKLGVTLTRRNGRRITLTEEGQRVHRWASGVVGQTRELEREMADTQRGVTGKAIVGASMTIGSYILPKLLASFHEQHTTGEISVHVTTPMLVTNAVVSGECDFALTILAPRHETSGLDIEHIAEDRLVLVASERSPFAADRVAPHDLVELPFVTAQFGSPRREIEEHLLTGHGVRRERIEMEFGHAEAIKQAVRAGAGVAFVFEASVRDELASGTLKLVQLPGMKLHVPIYCVSRKGKQHSSFQKLLMQYLIRCLRSEEAAPDI